MKKLSVTLLTLLCCFALALPVHADVIAEPAWMYNETGWFLFIALIAVIVLAVGFLIYWLLRRRRK